MEKDGDKVPTIDDNNSVGDIDTDDVMVVFCGVISQNVKCWLLFLVSMIKIMPMPVT